MELYKNNLGIDRPFIKPRSQRIPSKVSLFMNK